MNRSNRPKRELERESCRSREERTIPLCSPKRQFQQEIGTDGSLGHQKAFAHVVVSGTVDGMYPPLSPLPCCGFRATTVATMG